MCHQIIILNTLSSIWFANIQLTNVASKKKKTLYVDQKIALICVMENVEKKSDVGKRFGSFSSL
jgi:hypothetical protein